jgi:hypothetical protein
MNESKWESNVGSWDEITTEVVPLPNIISFRKCHACHRSSRVLAFASASTEPSSSNSQSGPVKWNRSSSGNTQCCRNPHILQVASFVKVCLFVLYWVASPCESPSKKYVLLAALVWTIFLCIMDAFHLPWSCHISCCSLSSASMYALFTVKRNNSLRQAWIICVSHSRRRPGCISCDTNRNRDLPFFRLNFIHEVSRDLSIFVFLYLNQLSDYPIFLKFQTMLNCFPCREGTEVNIVSTRSPHE